jgi:dGTPase
VITQVVSPAGGHAVHNRLTHALKVAQMGCRIAQKLKADEKFLDTLAHLNPNVVGAAGLAHDLGHPPFGHVAEEVLNKCLLQAGEPQGYEGNAQSFRIVTRLETREPSPKTKLQKTGPFGLDLTRASLNAILKYPRLRPKAKWYWRKDAKENYHPKFGAYSTELDQFHFARALTPGSERCLEAQIMDWADDITYAVHDSEDFYRVGMIPLERLGQSPKELDDFLERMFARAGNKIPASEYESYRTDAQNYFAFSPVFRAYTGSGFEKAALSLLASSTIRSAVKGTKFNGHRITKSDAAYRRVQILKELTWQYVIQNPRMAPQQEGKRRIIGGLFSIFADAAHNKRDWKLFPIPFQEQLAEGRESRPRVAADFIASLGEQRAVELHSELTGMFLKPIVTGLPI